MAKKKPQNKPKQAAKKKPAKKRGGPKRDRNGRFLKGECGNPGGRPKEVAHVRELAREYSDEAIRRLAEIMLSEDHRAAVAAANAILDRAWGKPQASVHVSGGEDLLSRVLALTPAQRAKRIEELQKKREGGES